MNDSFDRFGGVSAMIVGALSILYAIFFLVIARQAEYIGSLGSWLILAASGIFSSAAFVALYQRLRKVSEGQALWALLLGVIASFATLAHGIYQALSLITLQAAEPAQSEAITLVRMAPSQIDPAGLATFFVTGLAILTFSLLILRQADLPKRLGQLGVVLGILMMVLFFASAANAQTLILISGGLASVIVGPIWWIWLGRRLSRAVFPSSAQIAGPAVQG